MARMFWIGSLISILILSTCAGPDGQPPSEEPLVWTVGVIDRIALTDTPGIMRTITLHAARGEYEAFQIGSC